MPVRDNQLTIKLQRDEEGEWRLKGWEVMTADQVSAPCPYAKKVRIYSTQKKREFLETHVETIRNIERDTVLKAVLGKCMIIDCLIVSAKLEPSI